MSEQILRQGEVSGQSAPEQTQIEHARADLAAIERQLQGRGYCDEYTTAEVSADAQLVIAHALIDIAESLRFYLPGRLA